ncbi:gliding motility-associated C-terminal domain-containing protein [Pedobacter fastidiosus]|uniref:Gliding motility-associated C-terminal domain-containing protein n=1 Tax=Pedobacter fastidiosus TaxID=2765361 RepID=A0ABR7KRV2_9SPHI|nr:gliding motility-associated C-terminal domain-containing protein [Pedobacter fastidiosus]
MAILAYLKNMRSILLLFLLTIALNAHAQAPVNDDIRNAVSLSKITAFCSADGEFSNAGATPSGYKKGSLWNSEGNDIWYSFISTGTDVTATVTGMETTLDKNTLIKPLVAYYTYKENILTEQIGSMTIKNNTVTGYKGGLVIGQLYYLRISAESGATGNFRLCINSYNPPKKPGQDFSTASLLCNKNGFTEQSISGAGLNNREALGTCMSTESNSAWYNWTASNNGDLGFSITPTSVTDDIDWVLFDLGPTADNGIPSAQNAIRCASGSGIACIPRYYATGMNSGSIDLTEQSGCVAGQDGFVKSVNMVQGHRYALLIDNFSNGNNGFTLLFSGAGEFLGPQASINMQTENPCQADQQFTFRTVASGYDSLRWNFGEGASKVFSSDPGPQLISYSTEGQKTVILETTSYRGCTTITSYSFYVSLKPATPIILANKQVFCIGDSIGLSTSEVRDAVYRWTGPNGFLDTESRIVIPVKDSGQSGRYILRVKVGDCESDIAYFDIPPILKKPVALFGTAPELPGKFSAPAPITFLNQSKDADQFEWDFGDGERSDEFSPVHLYKKAGSYTVTLRASSKSSCFDNFSLSDLVLLDGSTLMIPNSFSPNGDGINDLLNINIANLKKFSFRVFNRYGESIFLTENIFDAWDGQWKGSPVPIGAYFYVLKGTDLFGKAVVHSGSITLIR